MELDNFDKAPPEKQRAVINAGFICFAQAGYQKTAMSEIAKAAGVSKAALFHYFGSKREMYIFLFRHACDKILEHMTEGTEDFFESIKIISKIKLSVMEQHPGMYEFLSSLINSDDLETTQMLRQSRSQAVSGSLNDLLAKVDWTRFKPGIDKGEAIEMVSALTNGYVRDNLSRPPDELAAKLDRYLNLLKQAMYKEEYL